MAAGGRGDALRPFNYSSAAAAAARSNRDDDNGDNKRGRARSNPRRRLCRDTGTGPNSRDLRVTAIYIVLRAPVPHLSRLTSPVYLRVVDRFFFLR